MMMMGPFWFKKETWLLGMGKSIMLFKYLAQSKPKS
jgi:hypothetical protein